MDRNPSPPPEVLQEDKIRGDAIGDTAFSERWLLKSLMRLTKELPEYASGDTAIELHEDLDQELCLVWDVTVEKDVALKLKEFEVVDIMKKVIIHSKAPRLTEICVGILGNLCFLPEISVELLKNEEMVDLIKGLLSCPDGPTISEAARLIVTSIWSWKKEQEEPPPWMTTLKNASIISSLKFILSSSKNVYLLQRCMQLLTSVCLHWMKEDQQFLEEQLCSEEFVGAVCEAVKETLDNKHRENREDLQKHAITFYYLMSICSGGTQALKPCQSTILLVCNEMLVITLEDIRRIKGKSLEGLNMTVILATFLIDSADSSRCLSVCLSIACEIKKRQGEGEGDDDEEEENKEEWEEAKEKITQYLVAITKKLLEESEQNKLVDCLESVDKLLTYLTWMRDGQPEVLERLKESLAKSSAVYRAIEQLKNDEKG